MARIVRLICLLASGFTLTLPSTAQNLGTGLYAFGSFDSRGFDSINLGNLNTHFEIPIINKQGRGINFAYTLVYDGLIWSPTSNTGTGYWQPDPNWGFHGQLPGGAYTGYVTYRQAQQTCPPVGSGPIQVPGTISNNYVYHDAFGRNHPFNYSSSFCPATGVKITGGSSSDGSGLSFNGLVHTRNGSIINAPTGTSSGNPGSITDSNGNVISTTGNGVFTDTLGVTALTISGSGTPGSPLSFTYPVTLQANGATSAAASIAYRAYTVQTHFQCSGVAEFGATAVNLVDHISLADGSTYSFTYESTPGVSGAVTGRLASVTLPTGGLISYSYTGGCSGSGINTDGTVSSLTMTTSDGTRTYSRASVNGNATNTTLQDEKGNQTLYRFTIANSFFYETHHQTYQGTIGGTPLSEVITCYNSAPTPCDGAAITLPIGQITNLSSYNGGSQLSTSNVYDAYGMLTASTLSSGGTPLKSVHNSYNTLEELTASTMEDQSGTAFAYSYYGYDETTPTATSGIPQHGAGSATRGNQTSAHISAGATYLTTTTTYYDTGAAIATTTPSGTTHYSYDPTQTFATNTTLPTPSSGVQLGTSASYDPQSGALISATGMNSGQTTQVTQYDPLLRTKLVALPNGSQVTYNFETVNQTGVVQTMGNGLNTDTESLTDGYGRTSRMAVYNGQVGNDWYQVDYCYDASGYLQFTSAKYQSTGFAATKQCSGSGTSYVYDALGRMTSSTNLDGTTTYQYFGRAVETTDVNGAQRITQYDMLGRISEVCEISSNGTMPGSGSPVACGTDIAGTGFQTFYSYNLANHLTTITQGAQTRTVQTDEAGRTVSTVEPERGTTTYSYAYNGAGLVVTRVRPQANQTNPSATTTTTTQYDSVGRVVSITYSDGTLNKNYSYDQAVNWGTVSLGASKGQLTYATVSGTGIQFAYNSMGQVTNTIQCLPDFCGNSPYDVNRSYTYDLAGDLTQDTYLTQGAVGTTVQTNYGYSPAEELTSISDTRTGNILSNMQDGPFGPTNYQFGNGLGGAIRYDGLGRLNAQWVCSGSTQYDCSGGTQVYGFGTASVGTQIKNSCDSVLGQCYNYGLDEFNRLISASVYYGPAQNFTYVYDRYGNRWQQNVTQGTGPSPSVSFSPANNQITTAGYTYDAAGNMTYDGFHHYTYDAEGNITQVDFGSTASYWYDAFNHRVQAVANGITTGYAYNLEGQRVATFDGSGNPVNNQVYWGSTPVAFYNGGQIHYQHKDWIGTERMQTSYNGNIEGSYVSLPWGDGYTPTGTNDDANHFAQLDHDTESTTDHAQFRQYSPTQGRWMSPDPYDGSYDFTNPQSLNRYSYVGNQPLSALDPLGLQWEYNPSSGCWEDWTGTSLTLGPCGTSTGPPPINCVSSGSQGCIAPPCGSPGAPSCNASPSGSGGGTPAPSKNVFTCASEFASKYSIAGGLQALGTGKSGVGGFITNALGGNALSGATDLIQSLGSGSAGGHSVFYNMGQSLMAGPRQGLPGGSGPWGASASDVATGAIAGGAFSAVTGAGQSIQTLNGTASLASVGIDAAEDFATGVGLVKFGYDALSYGTGLLGCKTGVIH